MGMILRGDPRVWSSARRFAFACFVFLAMSRTVFLQAASSDGVTSITWSASAEEVYAKGFVRGLRKRTPLGGIQLFDRTLIETDAPGAGVSEKGDSTDAIWGKHRARKVLFLDDPRAHKAFLVVFNEKQGRYPLAFFVNGHRSSLEKWNTTPYYMMFLWQEFPAAWLKSGRNVIELACPEAETADEGWVLYIARQDEFQAGGGDPAGVGRGSFRSSDGGRSWKESPFGPDGKTRAEYSVRLSLDRYVPSGWIETPVIDLWKEHPGIFIARMHTLSRLRLSAESEVPEGTSVQYFIRGGTDPGPHGPGWGPYLAAGEGAAGEWTAGPEFNRRYVQIRAVLSTRNPLVSPVLKSLSVEAEHRERYPLPRHPNVFVTGLFNPEIRYSSLEWEWESWDRPEFDRLRRTENLEAVVAGTRTQFAAQVRLLDHATKRWRWTSPFPEYPGWDALSILDRINRGGGGGMCGQYNSFLAGLCQSLGWQARLVNTDGHEVCEVWSDEFGKWIYLDASGLDHYLYDDRTGEPLNMLDLHERYLKTFSPGRTIDWTEGVTGKQDITAQGTGGVRVGSTSNLEIVNLIGPPSCGSSPGPTGSRSPFRAP